MSSSSFTPINGKGGASWQGADSRSSATGSSAEIAQEGARHDDHDAESSPAKDLQEQQPQQQHQEEESQRLQDITGLRTDRFPERRSSAEPSAPRGVAAIDGGNDSVREGSSVGATWGSDADITMLTSSSSAAPTTTAPASAATAQPSEGASHRLPSPATAAEAKEILANVVGDSASHPRKQRRTGMDSKISVTDAGAGAPGDVNATTDQDFDMEDAITLQYDGQTASVGRTNDAPFRSTNNGEDGSLGYQATNSAENDFALTTSATRSQSISSHNSAATQQRQQQQQQQQRPDNGDSAWHEPPAAGQSSGHNYPFLYERAPATGSMQSVGSLPTTRYRHAGLNPVRARGFANLAASTARAKNRSPGPGAAAHNGNSVGQGDSNDTAISVSGDIHAVPTAAERARLIAEDNGRQDAFSRHVHEEPPPASSTRSRARRFSANTNGSNRSESVIDDTPERDGSGVPTMGMPVGASAATLAARDRKLRDISAASFHMQTRNRGSSGSFSASQSSPPYNEGPNAHAPPTGGGTMNIIAATPSMMTRASTRGRPGYETLVSFAQMNGTRSGSVGSSSPRASYGLGHEPGPGQITLRTAAITPGHNGEDTMDQGPMNSSPTRIPSQKLLDALSDSIRRAIEADDMRLVHTLRFIQGRATTELGYLGLVDNALCSDDGMKEFKRAVRRVMRRVSKNMAVSNTTIDESARIEQSFDDNAPMSTEDLHDYTNSASPLKRRERRRERQAVDRKSTAVTAIDPNLTESAENVTTTTSTTMPTSTRRTRRSLTPGSTKITRTQSASSDHSSTSSLSTAKSVDLAAEALNSTESEKLAATSTPMPVAESETAVAVDTAAAAVASATATTAAAPAVVGRRGVPRVAKKKKPQRYQKPYAKGVNNENLRGPVLTPAQQERYKEMDKLNNPKTQAEFRQELPELDEDTSDIRTPAKGTTPVKETEDGPDARRNARRRAIAAVGAPRPRYSRRRRAELKLEEEELDEIQSPVDLSSDNEGDDDDEDESAFASEAGEVKISGRAAAAKARESSRALAKKRPRKSQGTQGLGSSTTLKGRRRRAVASPAIAGVSTRRVTRASAPASARQSSEPAISDIHMADATGPADSSDNGAQINDDYCYLCNGSGELLCCDGCVHSFHFSCLDPPMDPENPPDGRWFCSECEDKYEAEQVAKAAARNRANAAAAAAPTNTEVVMSSLLENADTLRTHPFQLPASLRNYYAGNKTGEKGEYSAVAVLPKKDQRRWAKTYASDERSNAHLYAITDNKGKFIFCVACGRTSGGNKPILICSFCPCAWHLDCLPFPVSNPPYQKINSEKPYHHWKCPNHVDHDLRHIRSFAGRLGNFRRPRNPRWIDIDVIPSNEDFNAGPVGGHPSYYDEEDRDGVVYRVHEKPLIMNFVERVKQENAMDAALKSFYRAVVDRQGPEWREELLKQAPQDMVVKAIVECEREAARDARRSGMQSRTGTRSEPASIAASGGEQISPNYAISTDINEAALGLVFLSNASTAPVTTQKSLEAPQKPIESSTNNAELSGLLKQLVSINQADQSTSESEVSQIRQARADQASAMEIEPSPTDESHADSHPSGPEAASGADDSEDTLKKPRQEAREEQLKREDQNGEGRSPTPGKGKDGKKRGHEDISSTDEKSNAPKSEIGLLQSIQAYVAERMRALGGEETADKQ
ncbi:nucleus protein [Ascosphaera apis ARSEF 7405]|uniref:Nucleus protein n=1 Tax=Ascosphaera apis ARSEF 7405 TaxID=392613 RepID=A0A167XB88_9EURO|nr:nucleus protein [Ascosphaera apis ARSEF 7405]